jgi:hypothetical protein
MDHPVCAGDDPDVMGRFPGPGEEVQVTGARIDGVHGLGGGLLVVRVAGEHPAEPPVDEVDEAGAVQAEPRRAAPEVGQPEVLSCQGQIGALDGGGRDLFRGLRRRLRARVVLHEVGGA